MLQTVLAVIFVFHAFAEESTPPSGERVGEPVVEWSKHTQKLTNFQSKAKEHNEELEKLVGLKNSGQKFTVDEKGRKTDILESIVSTHTNYSKAVQDYEKERKELKYRYPGEDDWVERHYQPLRSKSLQQVEREVGLNGQLTDLKKQIDKKYAKFRPKKQPENAAPVQNSDSPKSSNNEESAPKKLKLTK